MKARPASFAFAAAVIAGASLVPAPASADWTQVRTQPAIVVCWEKIDPTNYYGGVYQLRNAIVNDTATTQYARSEVYRSGTAGPVFAQNMTAAPGQWLMGDLVNMSMALNDTYKFLLNGSTLYQKTASQIPWQTNHCLVRYTGIAKVDTALRYGLSHLDAPYVGGNGYGRDGSSTGDGRWHQYGDQASYLSPLNTYGYDCSGLVMGMYRAAGIDLSGFPSSTLMLKGFPSIAPSQLRPGDLIVTSGHVAIYLGDGDGNGMASVLEATPTGGQYGDGRVRGVVINDASKYLGAGNVPKVYAGKQYQLRRVPGV